MESLHFLLQNPSLVPTGRLQPDDKFFSAGDLVSSRLKPQGVFEIDDEELCHQSFSPFPCEIPGCGFLSRSLLDSEQHYNTQHRFQCSQCRKHLATAHFLDLHLCESHDLFFAVQAKRKPSFRCFVEECDQKCMDSKGRMAHCVEVHHFPPDFRYDKIFKGKSRNRTHEIEENAMEMEPAVHQKSAKPKRGRSKKSDHDRKAVANLGAGSRGRGGTLNWYQRYKPSQQSENSNIVMTDLESALPQN